MQYGGGWLMIVASDAVAYAHTETALHTLKCCKGIYALVHVIIRLGYKSTVLYNLTLESL